MRVTVGDTIVTTEGRRIGTVRNLLFDLSEDETYAIVPTAGPLLAVPSEALSDGPREDVLVMDRDPDTTDPDQVRQMLVLTK